MPKEEQFPRPGDLKPEPGMSEDEWRAKNWSWADPDPNRAGAKARAGYPKKNDAHYLRKAAKRAQARLDKRHPLIVDRVTDSLHLTHGAHDWSKHSIERDTTMIGAFNRTAELNEREADRIEVEAGRKYDEERAAAERVIGEANPRTSIEAEEPEEQQEES